VQHHAVVALDLDVLPGMAPAVLQGVVERFEQALPGTPMTLSSGIPRTTLPLIASRFSAAEFM
jgi:hypothetical protein